VMEVDIMAHQIGLEPITY